MDETSQDLHNQDARTQDGPIRDLLRKEASSDLYIDLPSHPPRDAGVPDGVPVCNNMAHAQLPLAGYPGTNARPITLPFGDAAIELNRGCSEGGTCTTTIRQLDGSGYLKGSPKIVPADMLSDRPTSDGSTVVFFSNFMHSAAYLVSLPLPSGLLQVVGPVPVADPSTGWQGTWFPRAAAGPGEFGIFHVSFGPSIGLYLSRFGKGGKVLERDRLIKTLASNAGGAVAPGWDGSRYLALFGGQILFADGSPAVPLLLASGESVRGGGRFLGDGFVLFISKSQSLYAIRVGMDGKVK
ncbi:MAG: hypothetical protein KAI47_07220, partial [Deltaproteobacteria bacterium]|nr:hypothetical protein [Deltaproteobacteria bacterium]